MVETPPGAKQELGDGGDGGTGEIAGRHSGPDERMSA